MMPCTGKPVKPSLPFFFHFSCRLGGRLSGAIVKAIRQEMCACEGVRVRLDTGAGQPVASISRGAEIYPTPPGNAAFWARAIGPRT